MSGLNLIDLSRVRTWPPPLLTRCLFTDEQGNRPELVGILCARAVGEPPS